MHFIHDEFGRLIAEHNGSTGAALREYLWLGPMPVAFIDHSSGAPVTYYLHVDQVMNPQKLTNAAGAIVWDRVAEPFGVEISATGSLTQPLRFPGQRHDTETGFSQNWNRDYDPFLGRYIQSDPIGLMGGINTYAYVGGNPINRVDPTGEFAPPAIGPATTAVGGWIAGGGVVPDPTDAAWPKWAGYGALLAGSVLVDAATRPWRRRDRWHVFVRCHIKKEEVCKNCPDTIGGHAFGSTYAEAKKNAEHDANANLASLGAVGCQKRHCQPVACFNNGLRVPCPGTGR